MELKNGYQKLTYSSQAIHIFKQHGNLKLGLVSLPYGQVQDIMKFADLAEVNGKKIKVHAVLNCHYFNMEGDNGFLGRCQSFTNNGTTKGKGEKDYVGYDGTPTGDKPYMDLVVTHEGNIRFGEFYSWDWLDVMLGVAPAGILLDGGKDVCQYSPACKYSKLTTKNTQSLLVKCSDGTFALVAVSGKLSPIQCRTFLKKYGITHLSCYDSGGSTQFVVDGSKKVYTGRKIPTCFIMYEEIVDPVKESVEEPKQEEVVTEMMTSMVKCIKGTLANGTEYPTRATINSEWDKNNYKIKVGDLLQFDDVKPIAGKSDSYFQISGGTRPDLIGRWFAYDKNYFD